MVFSSHVFLLYFLPLTLVLYYALPRRARHLGLALVSYVFYGWANPLFVPLLFASTVIDYFCGLALAGRGPVWAARLVRREQTAARWARPIEIVDPGDPAGARRRRAAVALSVASNLTLLGFFKYFNFGVDTMNGVGAWLGAPGLHLDVALRVTLPLGISFYTFQSMSYTIDVARGHATALRGFIDFACYVSMFPQLVAGPIIRFAEVAGQLASRTHTIAKCARGVAFISLGLAKKVLLANPCGRIADLAFDGGSIGAFDAWFGAAAYAFQIYFDFSGYSDMAIGLGLLLGFVFPKNFDSPYRAESITDFWRRWHISLSSWLRDYLYVPLGGSRRGPRRTYLNLAVVMLLGGLWHGSAWTFVIWGAMHGVLLAAERSRGGRSPYGALPVPLRRALTFGLVLVSWVFFRAADLPAAIGYLRSMLGLEPHTDAARVLGQVLYEPYSLASFGCAAVVTWAAPQTWDWTRRLTPSKAAVAALLFAAAWGVLATQAYNPFIYFIF